MEDSGKRFQLADHSYVARLAGALILLDLKADDYILIERRFSPSILSLLSGSLDAGTEPLPDKDPELRTLLVDLEDNGSITTDLAAGKPVEFVTDRPNSLEVPGPFPDAAPKADMLSVARVASSLLKAAYLLRVRGLYASTEYVRNIRQRVVAHQPEADELSDILEKYHRIKPLFLDAKDRCLLNSLSMIIFLSRFGIVPNWWFGVTLRPFSAHCWVEDDNWLYNDQFARTHRYTPILRV
jgi:Transglutaminase-like superfamily